MSERILYSTNLTRRAEAFAIAAHGEQKYGELPYAVHLRAVYDVLKQHGMNNAELLSAAWLHDVIEDTGRVASLLPFPAEVVDIVSAVTDEPSANRKERKAATYPKIAANPKAIVLKLADRIANVRASKASNEFIFEMYRNEQLEFRAALYRDDCSGQTKAMWRELEGLLK